MYTHSTLINFKSTDYMQLHKKCINSTPYFITLNQIFSQFHISIYCLKHIYDCALKSLKKILLVFNQPKGILHFKNAAIDLFVKDFFLRSSLVRKWNACQNNKHKCLSINSN